MKSKIRTRFAPSPTGYLHVGGARTALYSWLLAKKHKGDFVLRIEDTDQARSTEESLQQVLSDLKWLSFEWQEGPEVNGPNQPYFQSKRQAIYQEHASRLLKNNKAYYCFCSDARLEQIKEEAKKQGRPPQYDGTCRKLDPSEAKQRIEKGEKATVRFKVPQDSKDYSFHDLVRNDVTFPSDMVGDFIILRSDGMPVYNFCCAVDDALMNISHVLRAEEHLSNTLRQLMIYQAFDYPLPQFGHVSIILGKDKQKLSKRHGATSCNEYRKQGYLAEAMINYLALLGWSPGTEQEIFSVAELVDAFSLERVHGSPAVFDEEKFRWMNAQHLRALNNQDLWQRIQPFLKEAGIDIKSNSDWQDQAWVEKAMVAFKPAMEILVDAVDLFKMLDKNTFQLDEKAKEVLSWDTTKKVLEVWTEVVLNMKNDFMTEAEFNEAQETVKTKADVKGKNLFMPLRVAAIGRAQGVELKQLVPLMNKQLLLSRVEKIKK